LNPNWSINMKSIRKVLAGTLIASGALLGGATGFSTAGAAESATTAPSNTPDSAAHGWGPWRIYSKLNLSDEQKTSIKSILAAAKPQMTSLREQMKANHQKLMQTSPDDAAYASVVAEVAATNANLASERTTQGAELKAQIYAVLSAPQKTQLAALEAQWAANPHHGHWGHRGPGAPPPDAAAE
jgi:Spy/CpxP family protein refolding chaperone